MSTPNKPIKVTNRSDGTVTYALPEMNIRRVFAMNESKDIPRKELNALFQMNGGAELIKHYLMAEDKEWVEQTFEAPIEYFWSYEEIKKCITEDNVDLFSETLDFAPRGVVDLIKMMSWQLPLTDLNKIEIIRTKLGFDVLAAIKIMTKSDNQVSTTSKGQRLRREEA